MIGAIHREESSFAMLPIFFNARKPEIPVPQRRGSASARKLDARRRRRVAWLREDPMKGEVFLGWTAVAIVAGLILGKEYQARAVDIGGPSDYKILPPIRHGNLTVFPVVSASAHDTSGFLTLDEGLKSGEVEVTESGNVRGMVRPRHADGMVVVPNYPVHDGAQVNKLVLVNNSKRPLLLLAGEIVTGGKQDRVISKDRIVPAESDPVDLSVFCVEPGRWVAAGGKYEFSGGRANGAVFAAPGVRGSAMAAKNQQQVWDNVGRSKQVLATMVPAPAAAEVNQTSSYARVMDNKEVQQRVDSVAEPVQRSYESVIHQLRDKNAVGVVVAVNGEVVWADLFASAQLLQKYWAKLVRSYATEALITRAKNAEITTKQAQKFLDDLQGRHQTVDTEPGVYRQTEITGDGFKVFELISLLPKTGFPMHVAKMAD